MQTEDVLILVFVGAEYITSRWFKIFLFREFLGYEREESRRRLEKEQIELESGI